MSETIPPLQPVSPPATESSTRAWEVLCHLSAAAGFIVPFGNIIGPLIVWLVKRGESLGVDAHGKESLNFQISWTIYGMICGALIAALWIILIGILFIVPLVIGFVAWIILTIVGAVKASDGQLYRYPLTIRLLK